MGGCRWVYASDNYHDVADTVQIDVLRVFWLVSLPALDNILSKVQTFMWKCDWLERIMIAPIREMTIQRSFVNLKGIWEVKIRKKNRLKYLVIDIFVLFVYTWLRNSFPFCVIYILHLQLIQNRFAKKWTNRSLHVAKHHKISHSLNLKQEN